MTSAQTTMDKYTPAEIAFAKALASRRIELDLELAQDPTRSGNSSKTMKIPITKIDGVNVRVRIRIVANPYNKNCMCLEIDNYAIGNIFNKWYPFAKETAYEDTKILLEVINCLKFEKTTNRFECDCDCGCKSNKNDLKPETWNVLFGENEKIKLLWDTCCVCHELTNSALRDCKHTICLICADKLDVDDEIGAITCPICRDTCSVHPTDEGEHMLVRHPYCD
jgi:hypothetical protein